MGGERSFEDEQQEKQARESRQTGGDAPAAGSIEDREAVAEDEQLFPDEDEPDEDEHDEDEDE